MKKTILAAFMPGLLALAFFSIPQKNNNTNFPPAPNTDNFLFGATDSWQDVNDNYHDYEQLGLNVWHTYMRDGYELPGRLNLHAELQLLFKTKTVNFNKQIIEIITLI